MKGLNKAMLIGRLGKEPEIRETASGIKVANFTLATDQSFKNQAGEWETKTEWHKITGFRYQAEYAEKNLKKGILTYVEGRISYDSYEDREGNKRYKTVILANDITRLDWNDRQSGNRYDSGESGESRAADPGPAVSGESESGSGESKDGGNLPF